mgnify:FL=1
MSKMDMNQASELQMLSKADFVKEYGLRSKGGGTSEYNTQMFHDAVAMAVDNPNKFIRFYKFTSKEYKVVKRKGQACAQFATKFFKTEGLDTFVATTRKRGYGVEVFLINEQPTT